MATESSESPAGLRISIACQECRKRKIRCDGQSPCGTCQQRQASCLYREFLRHRRRKNEIERDELLAQASGTKRPSRRGPSAMYNFPHSVSATHMASPSCQMQLYYGPTSYFSLMQHVYRDLVINPSTHRAPSQEVEEASAGLDLFSFRRIFFGTPDSMDPTKASNPNDVSSAFLPDDLAKLLFARFLSTLYQLMPYRPEIDFEKCLDQLYHPSHDRDFELLTQAGILIGLAIASLGTEHFAWGEVLYEKAKVILAKFEDVVNLQTVQQYLMMISIAWRFALYAHYQNEQGRPNSAFLLLGTATRKAVAAGLHKEGSHSNTQSAESIETRRITFWSLYIFEIWFCFHTGRPISLSPNEVTIKLPADSFLRLLGQVSKTISRSTDEIYGQCHESLLHMWRVARSIANDIRSHEAQFQEVFGFELDTNIQSGSLGVRQSIFTTLYYHTLLLTFRPFLMFRGHWLRGIHALANRSRDPGSKQPPETPGWLNEACNYALTAARKTIRHLGEASRTNDLVRELRYHGYFMGSSAFTLIFDLMHDQTVAADHLPWIYASLQTLSLMRPGDHIASSISAIQTTLRSINPSYEWPGTPKAQSQCSDQHPDEGYVALQSQGLNNLDIHHTFSEPLAQSGLPISSSSIPYFETPDFQSTGPGEDLGDFTQSDLGWDLDFSTMDLETFFSVNQFPGPSSAFIS